MIDFQALVDAGLSCIPIREDGSKAPVFGWSAYQKRLPTNSEAADWSSMYEGVALIGGAISGNLEIVDLDEPTLVRPYFDALKSLDATLPSRLTLVRTPRRNQTGQAGCHVLYRVTEPVAGNTKLAMSEPEPETDKDGNPVINPTTGEQNMKPRTLIETRGEGGYVLTVGCSPKCHPTGNLYEHVYGPPLTELSTLTLAERDTLHRAARMFDGSVAETHSEPPVRGYERTKDGDSPGDDFNRRSTWSEILEPHGWHPCGESGGIKRWRRPGKSQGISATTGVLSKAGNELLTVFSTNAHPFEGVGQNGRAGVSYSKFGAFAILNHHGDYEAAAKALLKLGYGTPATYVDAKPVRKILKTTMLSAEKRYLDVLASGGHEFISLGLPSLDTAIGGGVERGEMVIIGGLPSHGKSVCGLQALRCAVESRKNGVLVSHEMGAMTLAKRMLQSRLAMDPHEWPDRIDEIRASVDDYWERCGELFVLEQCRSIDAIEREVDEISKACELTTIVIDHAQLTDGTGGTRYEQLTNASGRFKALAVKHECAVVVLSQLNREAAKTGEYHAHNIKETGAFEQDADVIVFVQWPWKAEQKGDAHKYVFKIDKNRNRPIIKYTVEAVFRPAEQRIEEPPTQAYEEFEGFSGNDWSDD